MWSDLLSPDGGADCVPQRVPHQPASACKMNVKTHTLFLWCGSHICPV